ncbi:betaine aldehyde dehydrogenase [Rhodococcus opacus PD630]|uniref:aldehyde dehydrogenase family protein n=1 Tax=Rhodococcus opacus TaxID=37919 RepID=UPI00029CC69C|nr:aldehyde dehydrogenase family protein [Rhodococcus opacus]AHK34570.1 Putative aldehyde dehydrogenase [Rhodococcus opacus PD630]EHI39538.1 betaine aldehyde dehydrogenase [Rhodococcus opacus PD630]UDG96703.1 aldehyde dehydrogenase family protein [Rhodococcus opacus PD630]
MIVKDQIFINGKWVPSAGADVIPVISAISEEVIATIPAGTAEDVDLAAQAAADAFPAWSQTPAAERADMLHKIARGMEARVDEITKTIISELGYPAKMAEAAHARASIKDLQIAADSLRDIVWSEQVGDTTVSRAAAGVVGAITPWNGPMRMVSLKAGAALAAGCTVVLKGTELAPLSSFLFAEIAEEAGLPDGVFNLVSGTGPVVGEALVTHPLVDMVSLTGSVRAGRRVMELAAQSVKKVCLELGGKSANIILEDADLETAVTSGITDAFRNTGQACGALTRMLVPRSRLAEAEQLAIRTAESFVLGDPYDLSTTLGPVANASQRQRVRDYIQVGIDEGARLLTGGPEAPEGIERGFFVRPTVFSGDNSLRVAREEIFGPVVVIIPFDSEEEAFQIANDSQYGLAGAIWAGDADRAKKLASKLRAGRIRINGSPVNLRAPHGGFRLSGIGRESGRFGVEEYLEYKSIG